MSSNTEKTLAFFTRLSDSQAKPVPKPRLVLILQSTPGLIGLYFGQLLVYNLAIPNYTTAALTSTMHLRLGGQRCKLVAQSPGSFL